jgi:serine/threonine-protein kinase
MGERLESWKEIADHLGRGVRTVQRWALTRHLPVHRLPGGKRPRVFSLTSEIDGWLMNSGAREPHESSLSVAVLPFVSLSADAEGQYFGEGLASDIINALVRVPGLHVIARTSSFALSGSAQDVRQIGARLGAHWLIMGSIRRDHKRVRVSAQLVNTRDGCHAWSESYDRQLTHLFAIQDDIARSIALALKVRLSAESAQRRPTVDLAAYDLWVKGRAVSQHFTQEAVEQARGCYEAAIARDPRFALPYFGLAELLLRGRMFGTSSSREALERAREAIVRSLQLDDMFGEAHALLGACRGLLEYDWQGAEAAFQRARELSPGSAAVLMRHAWYHLVPRMRIAEAVKEAQQAVVLDPLSPSAHGTLGMVLIAARQYTRAAEACRVAVDMVPGLWWPRYYYGAALVLGGQIDEGFQYCRKVYDEIHQPTVVGALSMLSGLFLGRSEAKPFLTELEIMARTTHVPPLAFAWAYLGIGDDRVFEWLDKAVDAHDLALTELLSMECYDGIRNDARFRALLARMHLA